MESFFVRRASAADAGPVVDLLRSAEHLEVAFDPSEFWVAEARGVVVGCARLRRHADGACEIASVVVAEGLRRSGAGSALVRAALGGAREPVFALALASGFFARLGFAAWPEEALPEPLVAKARGLCASTGFVPMRWLPA